LFVSFHSFVCPYRCRRLALPSLAVNGPTNQPPWPAHVVQIALTWQIFTRYFVSMVLQIWRHIFRALVWALLFSVTCILLATPLRLFRRKILSSTRMSLHPLFLRFFSFLTRVMTSTFLSFWYAALLEGFCGMQRNSWTNFISLPHFPPLASSF